MEGSKHSNELQLLGHLYQLDVALYEFLKSNNPDTVMRIEYYGDFNQKVDGKTISSEVKEHICEGSLTDKHVDLWKTIDCWISAYKENHDNQYCLFTTYSLPSNSISFYLSPQGYNPTKAIKIMDDCSKTDQDKYTEYKSLSEFEKQDLFSKVKIYGNHPPPSEILGRLKTLLGAYPGNLQEELLAIVRSWWSETIIKTISERRRDIKKSDLDIIIRRFLESKIQETLPVMEDEPFNEAVKNRVFWKQLELVDSSPRKMTSCAISLLTTESCISKWMCDFLITDEEINTYKNYIKSSWNNKYIQMMDDLEENSDEVAKKAAGRNLLKEMDGDPRYIRNVQDDKIYNGFCHILSDQKIIGWHPDYESILDGDQ